MNSLFKKTYGPVNTIRYSWFISNVFTVCFAANGFANVILPIEPSALSYTQTRNLWEADPNLTGKGTMVGLISSVPHSADSSTPLHGYHLSMNHSSLYDADVLFMDGTDGKEGISNHETALAGVLLGLDDNANHPDFGDFQYRGACPDASVNVYEYIESTFKNLLLEGSVEEDIFVLGFGIKTEDWWVRKLELAAAEEDFLIVASNGNGWSDGTLSPLYPAAGSNVLSVGVIDSVSDANETVRLDNFSTPKLINSSIGPTYDGRSKPDMVAPGSALVPSGNDPNGYVAEYNWSSLSGPIVAGTAALLHQKAMSDPFLKEAFNQQGKSNVLKSILMNSAKKLPYWYKGLIIPDDDHAVPLDYTQGAGVLDAMMAYRQLTAGMGKPGEVAGTGWDNRNIQSNDWRHEYVFEISEPNQMITATLCWNRIYGSQKPFNHIVEKDANLRLELWSTDPNHPEDEVLLDYSDSVNDNVEHIYFESSPNHRLYAIRVKFSEEQETDSSVKHRYAVAWSVGPDRQLDDPWWYDLNEDNRIDVIDNSIYAFIDTGAISGLDRSFLKQALKLTEQRMGLLINGWESWKPYLLLWGITE